MEIIRIDPALVPRLERRRSPGNLRDGDSFRNIGYVPRQLRPTAARTYPDVFRGFSLQRGVAFPHFLRVLGSLLY